MRLTNISIIKDLRSDCYSILGVLKVRDYLEYIERVYQNRGGIFGQRDTLKTSSAIKIRKRMIQDIIRGTVLPPIVVGILLPDNDFESISSKAIGEDALTLENFDNILTRTKIDNISLIDGMQRTTAIYEAVSTNNSIADNMMRIEFWVVKNLNNLLYRMLILNTGQVPWNVRRQLEILFSPIKDQIDQSVPEATIYAIDDSKRRSASSQYQGDDIIELFLVFGSRKEKIELKERIADEFTRLDFIETSDKNDILKFFIDCFKMLNKLDIVFGKAKHDNEQTGDKKYKFFDGCDLFSSQPARIGFIVALSIKILGRPGVYITATEQQEHLEAINHDFDIFITNLKSKNNNELLKFLSFNILNEIIDRPSAKVGDFERTFFKEAFISLIEQHFRLDSFESCWRAY